MNLVSQVPEKHTLGAISNRTNGGYMSEIRPGCLIALAVCTILFIGGIIAAVACYWEALQNGSGETFEQLNTEISTLNGVTTVKEWTTIEYVNLAQKALYEEACMVLFLAVVTPVAFVLLPLAITGFDLKK
jgi:hypothetical protein